MKELEKGIDDLKYETLQIKKQLSTATSENRMLKVKIRKLQQELDKKNNHLETLLDPNQKNVQKILTERGASMIFDLRKRNTELIESLEEKDAHIKKMENELKILKAYLPNIHKNNYAGKKSQRSNSRNNLELSKINSFRTPSTTPSSANSLKTPNQEELMKCLQHNLQKIKEANILNERRPLSSVRINLNSEKPTASITKTNNNNNENNDAQIEKILQEIEKIKQSMTKLNKKQDVTTKNIKDRKRSIDILTKQVKHLKQFQKNTKNQRYVIQVTNKTEEEKEIIQDTKEDQQNMSYSQDSFENDTSAELNSTNIESDDDDVKTGDSSSKL